MNQVEQLHHKFMEAFPEKLQEGVLYISTEYATMSHLCACGCGAEVVTPLDPLDWRFIFDGKTVTVHPSIGNWSLECRSHYIIRHNLVHWADDWSDAEVAAGRARNLGSKRAPETKPKLTPMPAASAAPAHIERRGEPTVKQPKGLIASLVNWLSGR